MYNKLTRRSSGRRAIILFLAKLTKKRKNIHMYAKPLYNKKHFLLSFTRTEKLMVKNLCFFFFGLLLKVSL